MESVCKWDTNENAKSIQNSGVSNPGIRVEPQTELTCISGFKTNAEEKKVPTGDGINVMSQKEGSTQEAVSVYAALLGEREQTGRNLSALQAR